MIVDYCDKCKKILEVRFELGELPSDINEDDKCLCNVRPTEKFSNIEKKRMLKELDVLLEKAWNISNDLVGKEETSHSQNGVMIYKVREYIDLSNNYLGFIEY